MVTRYIVTLTSLLIIVSFHRANGQNDFYVYGTYTTGALNTVAIAGCDSMVYVGSYDGHCYIYKVTIPPGSDPNSHPNNPQDQGPIAPRTLTQIGIPYNFVADCGWNGTHEAEFYVNRDFIFYGPDLNGQGGIEKWIRNPDGTFGSYLGRLPIPVPPTNGETFGYDEDNHIWYTCTRARQVYSFQDSVDTQWQPEFIYPNYGGNHHDGLEFANGFLWVSDMTTDFIGQWQYTGSGPYNGWSEIHRFSYVDGNDVEGLGFGPLGHFWISTANGYQIYEIGGGVMQCQIFSIPDMCTNSGTAFPVFDLDDFTPEYCDFTWTHGDTVNLSVNIDSLSNEVTIIYPSHWLGSETIRFTGIYGSPPDSAGRNVTFTVCPVPYLLDIPNQHRPYQQFDLDSYLDPACGIDPSAVSWSASGMTHFVIEIDSLTHLVTVSHPGSSMEAETIWFTAGALSCCSGHESISATDSAIFYPYEACSIVPGDANGNGEFNGLDIIYGVNCLKGLGPCPDEWCYCPNKGYVLASADCNGDCIYNGLDITYGVNWLKGLGPAPGTCIECR